MSKGLKPKILALSKKGKSYKQIAKILTCSLGAISYHIGRSWAIKYPQYSDEMVNKYQEYYNNCKSINKTALFFGIARQSLRKRLTLKQKQSKEERKKKTKHAVCEWRRKKKIKAIEHKGGKCQVINCGYDKSVYSLSFHHINPEEKDFEIASSNKSWDFIKSELDKCILVCNNCHAEIHDEINKNGNSQIVNSILKI